MRLWIQFAPKSLPEITSGAAGAAPGSPDPHRLSRLLCGASVGCKVIVHDKIKQRVVEAELLMDGDGIQLRPIAVAFINKRAPWLSENLDEEARSLSRVLGAIVAAEIMFASISPVEPNRKSALDSALLVQQRAAELLLLIESLGVMAQNIVLQELAPWPINTPFRETETWKWLSNLSNAREETGKKLVGSPTPKPGKPTKLGAYALLRGCAEILRNRFRGREDEYLIAVPELARDLYKFIYGSCPPQKFRKEWALFQNDPNFMISEQAE